MGVMSPRLTRVWLERRRRAVSRLLSVAAENAEGAVYGTVMIGVLLAAEDARRETYSEAIGAAALVLVIYWLTSFYADILGFRLQTHERLSVPLLWRAFVHEFPVIEGAVVPLLALLIAWAAGATVIGGVTVGLWTTVVSLVTLEVAAGWQAGVRSASLWLQAGAGAALGVAIVGLKLVLY